VYVMRTLRSVLEASQVTLAQLARDDSIDVDARTYARALSAFSNRDVVVLDRLTLTGHLSLSAPFQKLIEWRRDLRGDSLVLDAFDLTDFSTWPALLKAEAHLCTGLGFLKVGLVDKGIVHLKKAAQIFARSDCPKQELRCLYKIFSAELKSYPDRDYRPGLKFLGHRALELDHRPLTAMIFAWLSREYQMFRQWAQALVAIDVSLRALSTEKSSQRYQLYELHKAHLLIESGDHNHCKAVFDRLRTSTFSSVQAGRIFLESKINPNVSWDSSLEAHVHPAFVERIGQGAEAFETLRTQKLAALKAK
jgi:hypothetical protein